MNRCRRCGGAMVGDNYTMASHCESIDLPQDVEADSGPWYCAEQAEEHSPERGPTHHIAPHNSCAGANTCATLLGDDVIDKEPTEQS